MLKELQHHREILHHHIADMQKKFEQSDVAYLWKGQFESLYAAINVEGRIAVLQELLEKLKGEKDGV